MTEETSGQFLDQAINMLSQADPLMKLLQEVKFGRMQATDAGLRAITESWLDIYRKVLESASRLDRASMCRLDPSPRLDMLITAGILTRDHPAVVAVRGVYDVKLAECSREG